MNHPSKTAIGPGIITIGANFLKGFILNGGFEI